MHDFIQALADAISLTGSGDPELVQIVALSLRVSLSASVIGMVIGAPLGGALAVGRFWGHQIVVVFVNGLLGLPPVVVGARGLLLLTRSGPLGFAGLLFTPVAMVIAQTILATPIVIAPVRRAVTTLLVGLW